MTDTIDKVDSMALQLKGIDWPIEYGWIKVKISNGKPVLMIKEESIRMD